MLNMSRRGVLASAAASATIVLSNSVTFNKAHAETPLEPTVGFYRYKVGSIEVTAVYDGIWRKPHDPAFIKDVSVDETKAALAKAGLTTEFMPIPLTVVVLKIGDRHDHDRCRLRRRPVAGERHPSAGQHGGRWHRPQRDRHDPDLAFPSGPCLGPDGEGHQRCGVPECRARRQLRRIQVVDRAGPGRKARPKAERRPASASPMSSRRGRTGSWSRAARKSHQASRSLRPWPHTRPFDLPRHVGQGPADGLE